MFDENLIIKKKMFVLKFYFATITQAAQHFYEKMKGSGAGSVLVANGSGMRIREAQKHKDPDQYAGPEHCFKGLGHQVDLTYGDLYVKI